MALVLKDRVLETSTSTGTGAFTLGGAQTGFQSFSVIGSGNTTYYTIQGKNADGTLTGEWEVGVGTYTTGSLARDTVLESSNANSLVVFSAGAKDVFCDLPAEKVLAPSGTSSQLLANDGSGGLSNVTIGSNLTYSAGTLSATGGSMVYPGAGIPNSTGSAWGTSYTTSGTGSVVPLATGAAISTPTITGGTINNATIGATTASTGAFTYISTSSSTSITPTLSFNASNSPYAAGATISGSYLQHLLQNKSATANASTNYVLSNDSGTDSTFYGEFGMNSSIFSASTPADYFSINNGVYFSSHDGDVTVGSGNGYKTYLAWGTVGQSAHVINASGAIGLNTNLGTTPALSGTTNFGTAGYLLASGGASASPTWAATTGTGNVVLSDSPTITTLATITGNLQLTGDTTATQNIATNQTTNALNIGGAGAASGTITIGRGTTAGAQTIQIGGTGNIITVGAASGIQPITIGRSGTALAVVNINTGASGGKITNIASNSSSGTNTLNIGSTTTGLNIFNVGTSAANQTFNLATDGTISTNSKTLNLATGSSNTVDISLGTAQTTTGTNITIGGDLSSNVINIASNGISSGSQTITIGSTVGTSTITINGLFKQNTYTVATLPTGSAGSRSFVTNALTPTFGAAVVGGGSVGVPVYHDGTSWKVG